MKCISSCNWTVQRMAWLQAWFDPESPMTLSGLWFYFSFLHWSCLAVWSNPVHIREW